MVSTDKHIFGRLPDEKNKQCMDCRFNWVVYGVDECMAGSNRSKQREELRKVASIISSVDESISPSSRIDIFRLGKYTLTC